MRILIALTFFLSGYSVFGISVDTVARYQLPKSGDTAIAIVKGGFAEPGFEQMINPKLFTGGKILSVNLVYTSYRLSPNFNQKALNNKRRAALFHQIPLLKKDTLITWKETVQTICQTPEEGRTIFHGFVIEYIPRDDTASISRDIAFLNKLFEEKPTPNMVLSEDGSTYVKYDAEKHGKRRPAPRFEDSVVLSSIGRNKWEGMLVVADLTASMHNYVAQVMYFTKKRSEEGQLHAYCFFNDGDGYPNRPIGNTGGIYHGQYEKFIDLFLRSKDCIRKRGRNDVEENDFEALLEGIDKYPDAKEVVLVVDNRSPVRDYKLVKKVNRPVHIILGHCDGLISNDYLMLAYLSGGSLHYKNVDLDFSNIENKPVKADHREYYIQEGRVYQRYL